MSYGIQPTGYIRKPISVILAELEAAMVTEFGPGVVQTPQTPLGQLNGLMADLLAEVDERNLNLYQSYDPDQAEGKRLDMLGRIRLAYRSGSQTDGEYRVSLTNAGRGRIDIQDLSQALLGLPGVTYARVFINDTGEVENPELERGVVAVAVMGGDDEEVAAVLREYVVPGISTYGNTRVSTVIGGLCRSMSIIRPTPVAVTVDLLVRTSRGRDYCPPPSTSAIAQTVLALWAQGRENGMDVSYFHLRSMLEAEYPNVELVSFSGARADFTGGPNQTIPIAFTEVADLSISEVSVA